MRTLRTYEKVAESCSRRALLLIPISSRMVLFVSGIRPDSPINHTQRCFSPLNTGLKYSRTHNETRMRAKTESCIAWQLGVSYYGFVKANQTFKVQNSFKKSPPTVVGGGKVPFSMLFELKV